MPNTQWNDEVGVEGLSLQQGPLRHRARGGTTISQVGPVARRSFRSRVANAQSRAPALGEGWGVHDGVEGSLDGGLIDHFDLVEDIADLVSPAAMDRNVGVNRGEGGEEAFTASWISARHRTAGHFGSARLALWGYRPEKQRQGRLYLPDSATA